MYALIHLTIVWVCLCITITKPQNTTVSPTHPTNNLMVGCGVEKKCISLSLNESRCASCNESLDQCDVLATWQSDVSRGLAYFELYTAVRNMDYVALGVSRNEVMGGSDVFACQLDTSGNVVLKDTWNTVGETSVNLLDPTQEGIEMIDWSYRDGGIYCKFSRDAIGRGYTDLNLFQEQLHLLAAVGIGRDLGLGRGVGYHTQKCYTPEKYSIAHEVTSGCGITKECLILKDVNSCESCSGSSCKFAITWTRDTSGTKVIFEIQSKYAELDYAAIGLSQNELMGDSDVFACQLSKKGGVVVKDTWNTVGISSYNVLDSDQRGIEMIDSVFSDGTLYCKFSKDVTRRSNRGFNLFDENFNFLFAVGKGKDNGFKSGVGYHTERCATFSKFNLNTQFSTPVDITAGCRETKQCLFIGTINDTCEPCLEVSCEFIAAWYFDSATNNIVFELEVKRSNVETIVVGVSNEAVSNGSEMYTCRVDSVNGVTVEGTYLPNTSPLANKTSLRVELISSRFSETSLYCKFERGEQETEHGFRILKDSFYLSFATKFLEGKQSNSNVVNQTCKTADAYFLKSTNVEERIEYESFCADSHCLAYKDLTKCQQDTECVKNNSCEFVVAWSYPDNKNQVTFYIRLELSGQSWAAIGFSNDTSKGRADVIGCQLNTEGNVVAKDTWNPDEYAPNELDKNQNGIKLISGHYSNNVLTCVMTRSTVPPVNSRGYNLLERPYYLVSAVGLGLDNELEPTGLPRDNYKCVSKNEIQLDAAKHSGANLPDLNISFVKAHGITMLLTWLIVVASGIYVAKFCRDSLTQKQWLNIHRAVNGMGVVLGCLGVIFAIIGARGWYTMPGNTKLIFHQIFGLTITVGIIANPLIALCRCKEDSPKRILFKVIHTLIGVSLESLALINISLGLSLYYTNSPTQQGLIVYLVIGIPAWVIVQAVYAIKTVRKPRKSKKDAAVEAVLVNELEERLIEEVWGEVNEEGEKIKKEPLLYRIRYRTKSFSFTAIKLLAGVAYWVSMVIVFITTSALIIVKK